MVRLEQESDHKRRPPLPAPVPGGSESVESLGSLIDRLMGDKKARDRAAAALNRWTLIAVDGGNQSSPTEEEPTPAVPPPPVPGGNESITKGDDPPGETR